MARDKDIGVDVFNLESLTEAINQLRHINLTHGIRETLEDVRVKAEEIVREEIERSGAVGWTGELLSSVHSELNESDQSITVYVDADYAIYVEYGTGVVGASNPHPDATAAGYRYNVRGRNENEYWSFEKDGKWYSTKGQEPKAFMLRAEQRIREYLESLRV